MTDPAGQPVPPYARPPYPAQPYPVQSSPTQPYPGQPPQHPGQAQHPGQPQFVAPGAPRPQGPYAPPLPARRTDGTLGVVALIAGVIALVGASIAVSIAAYQIGLGAGRQLAARALTTDFDWSILAPVRDWVLLGEISFWVGTVFGLWALAQGIVAIVTGRGRGAGIAAAALAVAGPIAFIIALNLFLGLGLAAGFPAAVEEGTLFAGGVVLLLG